MAADGSPAAFFDLDRTLMEGSSAFQFGRAAYKAGLLSRRQLIADGWANLVFRLRGASDESSHELRLRISESLEGTRVRDMERLGVDVLAGVLPRIYPQVLEIAYRHQDDGVRVYIVTAASQELASMLAGVLAFDGAIGSQFSEVVDGVYTGTPSEPFVYGRAKATAIEHLAQPMLRLVGHPVAVNPDSELTKAAREERWEVLRFDRLGRRLKAAVGLAGAAIAGGAGSAALAAHHRRRRGLLAKAPLIPGRRS
jgi:HAD superfamily phosphoserine phosphatase-like hydrolase